MNKIFKIIILFLATIFALGVVFYVGFRIYISANSDDVELQDDSNLMPHTEAVNDEENAWTDLIKAEEVMYYPEEHDDVIQKMVLGETWDEDISQEIVEKNQEMYRYIDIALTKEFYANPSLMGLSIDEYDVDLPIDTNSARKLKMLYLVDAKNDLLAGEINRGIEKTASCIVLGNLITNSFFGISMIDYLVGMDVANTTYDFIENNLLKIDLTDDNITLLQDNLEIKGYNGLENIYKIEYYSYKNAIGDMEESLGGDTPSYLQSKSSVPFYFKKNMTKNDLAFEFSRAIENTKRNCNDLIIYEKKFDTNRVGVLQGLLTENAIGKILIDMTAAPNDNFQKKICETNQRREFLKNQLDFLHSQE